jgi:hypothetical protein
MSISKLKKVDLSVYQEVRDREAIKLVLLRFEEQKESFAIDGDVIDTIFSYNNIAPELPEDIGFTPGDRRSVQQVHKSSQSLQAMADFVSTKYLEAQTRLRVISKIERNARNEVISSGNLTRTSTGPTTDKTMQFVLPELYEQKDKWENFRDLCKHVLGRLRDAMFLLQNQTKAEEIFRSLPRV